MAGRQIERKPGAEARGAATANRTRRLGPGQGDGEAGAEVPGKMTARRAWMRLRVAWRRTGRKAGAEARGATPANWARRRGGGQGAGAAGTEGRGEPSVNPGRRRGGKPGAEPRGGSPGESDAEARGEPSRRRVGREVTSKAGVEATGKALSTARRVRRRGAN